MAKSTLADHYVINIVLGPALCHPLNPKAASVAEKILLSSLSSLEKIWLNGDGQFLLGAFQLSIVDLSLVCELIQLEVLDEKDRDRILSLYKKVVKWIEHTRAATNPYFEEVHNILFRVKKNSNNSVQGMLNLGLRRATRWGGIPRFDINAFMCFTRLTYL